MFYKKIKAKQDDIFKNKLEVVEITKKIFGKNGGMSMYPAISSIISILLFVFLIIVSKGSGAIVLALFIWYLLFNVVIVFFNTATIECTKLEGSGRKPTFSSGIGSAFKKTNLIINWALFKSTAGLFVNVLSDLKLAKGFAYSGEIEWSLVANFVLPIMISENKSIKDSVDEAQKQIKKNWGKNPKGEHKISFVSIIPFLIVLSILILSSVLKDEFVTYGLFILTIFVLILGYLVNLSLRSIFYTIIYYNVKNKAKK
jgi:hypothetical protein